MKYSVYKKYRSLFGIPDDQEEITEQKAKEILTRNWLKTNSPHPLGLSLFSEHPDKPSDLYNPMKKHFTVEDIKELKKQLDKKSKQVESKTDK